MRLVRTLLLVLIVCCIAIFGALIHSRRWGHPFQTIRPGDSTSSMLQRTGPPTRTMACAALPEPPAACDRVLVFAGPLSAVVPEFWLVALNHDGQVLRVFHTTRADQG